MTTAGLKLKVPFIQEVNPIDKRVLEWDGRPSDMPTKDKLYISVDLFARWRITDPLQYFLRLRDERSAQSRLDDILGSETRNAVAKHELIEIIRTTKDRVPLRDTLLTEAERELDMGSLVPIQKGRQLVEQEIFRRRRREGTSVRYRAARHSLQADQLQRERASEDLRSNDQRTAATVDLYEFTRTMQAYKSIIAENTTLVLSTDSDLFQFLKGMTPDTKP